jgi:tRNA(Ile)-lysidine synthase TilS/MesJ
MAAYCVLEGIDYIVEECPMAEGNRHLGYKNALNEIEDRSPGSKAAFLFGFLERVGPLVQEAARAEREALHPCPGCGAPTVSEVCAFCKLVTRAGGHRPAPAESVAVDPPTVRSAGDKSGTGEW